MRKSRDVGSMKGNVLILLLNLGHLWVCLSETMQVNDGSPTGIPLNSEGHQLWKMGKNWPKGLSFARHVALGKCLGLMSPSALQANPSYLVGLFWEWKAPI